MDTYYVAARISLIASLIFSSISVVSLFQIFAQHSSKQNHQLPVALICMLINIASNSLMAKYFGEDQEAKSYIRHFSAEAFAFLMRKSRGKGLTEIVQHILTSLREDSSEAYVEGIAMLFFECLKVNWYQYDMCDRVY